MKWSLLGLAVAATFTLTACGPSASSICEAGCDCEGCSDNELEDCIDDIEDLERAAENEGCADQYDEYLSCVDDELRCDGDDVDIDGCEFEANSLGKCMN